MKVTLTAGLALIALDSVILEGASPWAYAIAGFVAAMTTMNGR